MENVIKTLVSFSGAILKSFCVGWRGEKEEGGEGEGEQLGVSILSRYVCLRDWTQVVRFGGRCFSAEPCHQPLGALLRLSEVCDVNVKSGWLTASFPFLLSLVV